MTEVCGQFNVTLTTPIAVSPDTRQEALNPCKLDIEDSEVALGTLKISPMIDYGDGAFGGSELTDIRVWISREVELSAVSQTAQQIPREEQTKFEQILIAVTRRFVTAVKQSIGQWDLDTRHPVYSYTYKYLLADTSLDTSRPLSSGSRAMPEYAKGTITLETHKSLTTAVWRKVEQNVKAPVELPFYEELLYDARTFRDHMQYDTAILFAAVATEVVLKEACLKLLSNKRGLSSSLCDSRLRNMKVRSLVKLMKELEPSSQVNQKDIEWLFDQRNKIAHGKTRISTWQDAATAIKITKTLKRQLSGPLNSNP